MADEELSSAASLLVGAPEDNQSEGTGDEPGTGSEGSEHTDTDPADTGESSDQAEREGDSGGGEGDGDGEGETPERVTVAELAEQLEMDAGDLYDTLEVPLGEGTATLGELKDRAKELAKSEEMLQQAQETVSQANHEAEQVRRATAVALQQLGRAPTQAEIDEGNRRFQEYAGVEAGKLLEMVPEWRDQPTAAKEHGQIAKFLRSRQVTDAEISQIVDHRMLGILREHIKLLERFKAAENSVERGAARRQAGGRKPRKRQPTTAEKVKADVAAGRITQEQAALALITGANQQ